MDKKFYKKLKLSFQHLDRESPLNAYRFETFDNHIKLIPSDIITQDKALENFLDKYFNYELILEDWRDVSEPTQQFLRDSFGYFVCFQLKINSIKNEKNKIKKIIENINR